MNNPLLICLEDNNYVLRQLHKEMTGAASSMNNLKRSRHQTEHELMQHLGHDNPAIPVANNGYIAAQGNPPTEQQAKSFVLRALIREGYIKSAKLR